MQQLNPFSGETGKIQKQSSKVAARPAQRAYQAAGDRIRFEVECDDRYCRGGITSSRHGGGSGRSNERKEWAKEYSFILDLEGIEN